MGREIRRVPPNWKHPRDENGHYKPMYDKTYDDAAREWICNCITWVNGTHDDLQDHPELKDEYLYYWEWNGDPPDREYYLPKSDEQRTWYQVYETVSEGTPVTPAFATAEELIDYLVANGDEWDQRRVRDGHKRSAGWDRRSAERFVNRSGWFPSLIIRVDAGGSREFTASNCAEFCSEEAE